MDIRYYDNKGNSLWRAKKNRSYFPLPEYKVKTVEKHGSKVWFKGDYLHRENGPAIEYKNGDVEYFLNGWKYDESDYIKEMRIQKLKSLKDG